MILGRTTATATATARRAGGLSAMAVLALALAGCAGTGGSSQPSRNADGSLVLSGVFAGNAPAKGAVREESRGAATFTAQGPNGLSCTGTFELHGEATQFVPFTCTNGRNGQAVVTLLDSRQAGSIVLVYDSGPQRDYARFAFGSLPFKDAFEANPR